MSAYITLYRDIQDAKFGPGSQLKRSLYFDSQHHHDQKGLKKNQTNNYFYSHLKIQRHLDTKLYSELTFFVLIKTRRGYRYLQKTLK